MQPLERLLYKPIEVGEAIGVNRAKAYELIASKEIPSIRVGGSLRVPVDALRSWIQQQLGEQTSGRSADETGRAAGDDAAVPMGRTRHERVAVRQREGRRPNARRE